jgi:hypothetical protein
MIKFVVDNQKSRRKFVFDRQFKLTINFKKLNTVILIIHSKFQKMLQYENSTSEKYYN